jgi:cytoskeletal protein CcmA (bactofilin family)
MFRQQKRTEETSTPDATTSEVGRDQPLPLVRRTPGSETASDASNAASRVDQPRRPADPSSPLRRPMPPTSPVSNVRAKPEPGEGKRLTVGRDICVRGEITACDVLVVEGRVEASIAGSNLMEIAETGLFKGDAEIDHAEIAGRFEGNLVVRDRLFISATGKVTGSVRYRRLEIELGGELIGEAEVMGGRGNGNTSNGTGSSFENSSLD